jgi:Tfp pilus assembly protein PilO
MKNLNQHEVYWFVVALAKKLGAWGLLGLVIGITSSVLYQIKMPELKHSIALLQVKNTANVSVAKMALDADAAVQTTEIEMADLYQQFPTVDGLPEALAQISRIASEQDLALNSGDYELKQIKQSKKEVASRTLNQYEFVLPVQGHYLQIRHFISTVLQALPALALTDLQIGREHTLSSNVDAKMTFVLYAKGDAWSK